MGGSYEESVAWPTGTARQKSIGCQQAAAPRGSPLEDEQVGQTAGDVVCDERLGGLLKYYNLKAA
jgi:hypothetical protein